MWLAISSLPRTSYAGSVYEASSAKLASNSSRRTASSGVLQASM